MWLCTTDCEGNAARANAIAADRVFVSEHDVAQAHRRYPRRHHWVAERHVRVRDIRVEGTPWEKPPESSLFHARPKQCFGLG